MDELERLLRSTVSDERRALPGWPDPATRVRRAAHARNVRLAAAATSSLLAVAAAIAVSVVGHHDTRAGLTSTPPTTGSPPAPATPVLPGPGAEFPASVYPSPVPVAAGSDENVLTACPNPAGLQPPGSPSRATVVAAMTLLARGTSSPLDTELRGVDRTEWAQLAASRPYQGAAGQVQVLFAGPLLSPRVGSFGPPDPSGAITRACGAATATDSYAVVEGPPDRPALQEVVVFVRRGDRLLAYFQYP